MSHRRGVGGKVNADAIEKSTTIIEKVHSSTGSGMSQPILSSNGGITGGGNNVTSVVEIADGITMKLDSDEDDVDEEQEIEPLSTAIDEKDRRHKRRLRNWKDSPFAVGLTEPTWADERIRSTRLQDDDSGCLCCSAYVCPLFGASRVGNMAVLKSSVETIEMIDEENSPQPTIRRITRPKLDVVVGPYWPMLCCVTYPLIFGVSGWAFFMGIYQKHLPPGFVICWTICTFGLIISLGCTAFRDPGILYRVRSLPPHLVDQNWRWSDQADSYRPRSAWYDGDTAVIVEGFDHTYVIHVYIFFRFELLSFLVLVLTNSNSSLS